MADDITLTVRVRDMTRGEFAQLRQRLRGMDRDVRSLGNSTNQTSERANRLSQNIRGVSQRMSTLQRTGSLANADMDHMRRTMGLLSRDLRQAARAGDITEDQFRSLRDELDNTRLSFDYLDRDIRRHNSVAQRAARDSAAAQRDAMRRQMADARLLDAQRRRMLRAEVAAYREADRRRAADERETLRRQQADARSMMALRRRIAQAEIAAYREEAARNQRALAQRQASANQMANLMRRQEADLTRNAARMAGLSGDDHDLSSRFRGMDDGSLRRMARSLSTLGSMFDGINGSSGRARTNVRTLGRDLSVMSQVLANARREGNMTRRDFNALSNGLRQVDSNARALRSSGDISRSALRSVRRELNGMRSQMTLLNGGGTVFARLGNRLHIFQRGLRDSREGLHGVRRAMNGIGDGMITGLRGGIIGLSALASGMRRVGAMAPLTKRWLAIILAVILLLGPAAAALGAILTAALGGAFIALGAFALKGSAAVKSAFKDMKTSVAGDVRDAAKPMEQYLVLGMKQVSNAVQQMAPALRAAFTASGPLVEDFIGAFTELANMSMPGIVKTLQSMGPLMDGFRQGMGLIGKGIGDMFDAMTANGGAEALGQTWITLGDEMRHLLTEIGKFINFSAKSATATMILVGVFRLLVGILHFVEFGLNAIDKVFGSVFRNMLHNGMNIDKLTGGLTSFGTGSVSASKDVSVLKKELDNVNSSLAKNKEQRDKINEMKIPKSMKDRLLDANTESTNELLGRRDELTQEIAAADADAASAARNHATAVDALKASIQALNEQALGRLDAKAAMEKSIDDAVKKAKELKGKVSINSSGEIDLNSENGRAAQEVMSALVKSTTEYAKALTDAKAPQYEIDAAWKRGRESLIGLGAQFGISKTAMSAYADQVLQTPETVTTKLKVEKEQAEAAVAAAVEKIKSVPKEQKSKVTLEAQRAMERASMVDSKLNALNGKVATSTILINTFETTTIRTIHEYQSNYLTGRSQHEITGATGGLFGGNGFTKRGFASGGRVSGPGTGTSDDVFAPWLSDGEFVINARQTRKYLPLIEAINSDKMKLGPGFAKGGKVKKVSASAKAASEARKELAASFGISVFGKIAGYKNNTFENNMAKPGDMSSLVTTLNGLLSSIKKAFSGKAEKNLISKLMSSGKALIKHERNLIKVNGSLEKAKTKLDDLKQSAASLNTSVLNGVMTATDITKVAAGEDKNITMVDVMNMMRQNRDKATAFSGALSSLKSKGVSKEIIQQIAEAGIEGGGLETAGALMTASASEIGSLNTMQSSINAAAKASGKTASDAMYAAGIQAAQGLVNGLTKQKAAIEKAMMNIAKSMEKSIKKALGIKSPSKVMQEVGHYTAEGFAVGMTKNSSVDTAWASMLNTPSSTGSAGTSGGSGGGEVVIPVYIGNRLLDEIILDSNRRTVRTRGGNVQAVYGR